MFPKQVRIKDAKHLKGVRSMPCYVPTCRKKPCDAHHLMRAEHRGTAFKTNDDCALPFCRTCHSKIHAIGELQFFELNRMNYDDAINFAKTLYNNKNYTYDVLSL